MRDLNVEEIDTVVGGDSIGWPDLFPETIQTVLSIYLPPQPETIPPLRSSISGGSSQQLTYLNGCPQVTIRPYDPGQPRYLISILNGRAVISQLPLN